MKKIFFIIVLLGLQGCSDDISDVEQFVESVKVMRGISIEPVPEPAEFKHFEYNALSSRSPFVAPQQEQTVDVISQSRDCLQPDTRRNKTALEAYGLDNLVMRGTLGQPEDLWALVETINGDFHRIRKGYYLGLFHGQITKVNEQQIELVEIVPDGSGCWVERSNNITLVSASE